MQNYTELADSVTLQDSRGPLLNNHKTIMSNNSGTVFPTANLQVGMLCFRTDLVKLYECTDVGLNVWKLIVDLNNTATDQEYVDAQVGTKQNTISGAASTIVTSNLTASTVAVSNASGKVASSGITVTKLNYLTDVTSNIQAQINGKAPSSHDHSGFHALESHSHASYVNKFAFKNVATNSGTAVADNEEDTLTLIAGSNMSSVTASGDTITFNAATQGVALASVGQNQLKTGISSVGKGVDSSVTMFTLSGGQYGFYPQTHGGGGGGLYTGGIGGVGIGGASYATVITLNTYWQDCYASGDYDAYAQQRYLTASPPYNLGNGDIPVFVFAMIDITTGRVDAVSTSETPPWAYNGKTNIRADFYKDGKGFQYKKVRTPSWVSTGLHPVEQPIPEAGKPQIILPDKEMFIPEFTTTTEVVEITQAIKNADIADIPHPFSVNELEGKVVVMLDPLSPVAEGLLDLLDGDIAEVSKVILNYLVIDNTPAGFNTSPTVMPVKVKWKGMEAGSKWT